MFFWDTAFTLNSWQFLRAGIVRVRRCYGSDGRLRSRCQREADDARASESPCWVIIRNRSHIVSFEVVLSASRRLLPDKDVNSTCRRYLGTQGGFFRRLGRMHAGLFPKSIEFCISYAVTGLVVATCMDWWKNIVTSTRR